MIPLIGLMTGAYIMTRMLSLLTITANRAESAGVKVFAAIKMILTAFCVLGVLEKGATTSTP